MNPPEKTTQTQPKWVLLGVILSCFLMGFIVRFAWPPLAALAAPDLNIDLRETGSYVSAFYIGYVIMHIPAGVIGDRFGVRMVITVALVVEGVATLLLGTASDFTTGFLLRICAGLGAGCIFSTTMSCITRWFSPQERGIAFGLLMMAPTGGGVLLPNLIMPPLANLWGWQGAFAVIGGCTLLLAAIALWLIPSEPREEKSEQPHFFAGLLYVIHQRNLLLSALAGWGLMWSMVGFISFANTYMQYIGFTINDAGIIMACFGIGGIVGPPISGWLMGSKVSPRLLMMYCLLALIPFFIAFAFVSQFYILLILAGLSGFLFGLANAPLPLLISLFSAKEWTGTAGGVTGCIFQTAAIFAPLAVGWIFAATRSPLPAFITISAGISFTIIVLIVLAEPPSHAKK